MPNGRRLGHRTLIGKDRHEPGPDSREDHRVPDSFTPRRFINAKTAIMPIETAAACGADSGACRRDVMHARRDRNRHREHVVDQQRTRGHHRGAAALT
jgi:hypothetical protein